MAHVCVCACGEATSRGTQRPSCNRGAGIERIEILGLGFGAERFLGAKGLGFFGV